MRFGDIVICAASLAVISALISGPVELLFIAALGFETGFVVGMIVSLFIAPLITGYIFAGKLREDRRETIAKIAVLSAAFNMLIVLGTSLLPHWGPLAKEEYEAAYPGTTLSTQGWLSWEMLEVSLGMLMLVGLALVLGFIGLYAGSMLRRPTKSQG